MNVGIVSEDVKSLSLPGTYHEKIISLGSALRKFTRLKSLDLSRNALETIDVSEVFILFYFLHLLHLFVCFFHLGVGIV